MLLNAITGMEQKDTAMAKMHLFWAPMTGQPGQEVHIGQAHRNRNVTGISQVRVETQQARPGFVEEFGVWYRGTYDINPGTLLKLFGTRTPTFSNRRTTASMFIQMREGAALRRVKMDTLGLEGWALHEVTVQGHFDVLTMDEARELGAVILPQFRRSFEPREVDQVFAVTEIERESRGRPRVRRAAVVIDGKEKVIETPKVTRRIRI